MQMPSSKSTTRASGNMFNVHRTVESTCVLTAILMPPTPYSFSAVPVPTAIQRLSNCHVAVLCTIRGWKGFFSTQNAEIDEHVDDGFIGCDERNDCVERFGNGV